MKHVNRESVLDRVTGKRKLKDAVEHYHREESVGGSLVSIKSL